MRIALIHYASPPVIGGVERIIGAHARLFAKAGHDVMVISQRGDSDLRLEASAPAGEQRAWLEPVLRTRDTVFVHNVMTMPFDLGLTEALAQLARELPATRFLAWVHDLAAINPDLAPVPDVLGRAADGFEYVAVSELRARQFASLTGISPRVIPNGIDPAEVLGLPEALAKLAEQLGLLDGRPVLLHPTRLLRRKNVEFGLHVMSHARGVGARLLITGAEDPHNAASKEYASWLRSERNRLGLNEEVIFLADHLPVGDAELAALYRVADALFLPSRQEGFGLPVLEAALHRMPAFIAEIEPLNEIASSTTRTFSLGAPASEVARLIVEALEADAATQARKGALQHRWRRIYERHLAPLLSGK